MSATEIKCWTRVRCEISKVMMMIECNDTTFHEWLSHPQGGAIKDDLREQRDQKTRSPPLKQRPKPQKKAKEGRIPRPEEDFRNIMVLHIPRRSPLDSATHPPKDQREGE